MICGALGLMIVHQSERSKHTGNKLFNKDGLWCSKDEHALAIQMLSCLDGSHYRDLGGNNKKQWGDRWILWSQVWFQHSLIRPATNIPTSCSSALPNPWIHKNWVSSSRKEAGFNLNWSGEIQRKIQSNYKSQVSLCLTSAAARCSAFLGISAFSSSA